MQSESMIELWEARILDHFRAAGSKGLRPLTKQQLKALE